MNQSFPSSSDKGYNTTTSEVREPHEQSCAQLWLFSQNHHGYISGQKLLDSGGANRKALC